MSFQKISEAFQRVFEVFQGFQDRSSVFQGRYMHFLGIRIVPGDFNGAPRASEVFLKGGGVSGAIQGILWGVLEVFEGYKGPSSVV